MADMRFLSEDDRAFLYEFIHQQKSLPKGRVRRDDPPPMVGRPQQWIGRVLANQTAGALAPGTMFSVRNGPGHATPETEISQIEINYAWLDVSTSQWAGAYKWQGVMYVSPLSCPPAP